MKINVSELILRARGNEPGAQDELMSLFKNTVKARAGAYYLTGGDRDDLIQEGMIGLFKALRDYDPSKNDSFAAFADMCVNRQIQSAVKASARMKHKPLNTSVSIESKHDPVDADDGDPETLLIEIESANDFKISLHEAMSEFESNVYALRALGYRHEYIASLTGKNVRAVENALQRVRRKAGKILSDRSEEK